MRKREFQPPARVGYKKPPVEHRFQKGRSGNPRGRPRKAAVKPAKSAIGLGYVLLEEAYRPVSLREGDQVIELPVIRAVLRSLGVAAMKGSRLAQVAMAEMVKAEENKIASAKLELLEHATRYKADWEPVFNRCEREGRPPPDLLPHPDDVIIEDHTQSIEIIGPTDRRSKRLWDDSQERKQEFLNDIAAFKKHLKRDPQRTEFWQSCIDRQERVVDMIDLVLPDEEIRRDPHFSLDDRRERMREMCAAMRRAGGPAPPADGSTKEGWRRSPHWRSLLGVV